MERYDPAVGPIPITLDPSVDLDVLIIRTGTTNICVIDGATVHRCTSEGVCISDDETWPCTRFTEATSAQKDS